jgi:hypothetical protein
MSARTLFTCRFSENGDKAANIVENFNKESDLQGCYAVLSGMKFQASTRHNIPVGFKPSSTPL